MKQNQFIQNTSQYFESKVVKYISEDYCIIEYENRNWKCKKSDSCMMIPNVGDEVLVYSGISNFWILSILRRKNFKNFVLSTNKNIVFESKKTIFLKSNRCLIKNKKLKVKTKLVNFYFRTFYYYGNIVNVFAKNCILIGKYIESIWNTINMGTKYLFRKILYCDYLRCGQIDYQSENYTKIHGKYLLITSKSLSRIDGEQIHMG